MSRKLSLTNMIYNIVATVMYLISVPTIFVGAFAGAADGTAAVFYLIAVAGLVLAIVNLMKDKKENYRITSSVLAIVGHGLFLLGAILFVPALTLTIIASIFYGIDFSRKSKLNS